ncbi:hypothetical protein M231_00360 [Tremella mesenterica]|uniref:Uncharacterized protein n=1 Tax=Tremella mesenterica TaxID=5217 RepID=A0A4Q1BW57_TREME|nr:hypothetical protein M231_00360 [Tremella mesenterica]
MTMANSRVSTMVLLLLGFLLFDMVMGLPKEFSRSTRTETNADRFRRGLPPKVPNRRYNATLARAAPAKRSGVTTAGYLQATPVAGTTRKRAGEGTPYGSTSWVSYVDERLVLYSSSSCGGKVPPDDVILPIAIGRGKNEVHLFIEAANKTQTTDPSQATFFTIPSTGSQTNVYVADSSSVSGTKPLCLDEWSAGSGGRNMKLGNEGGSVSAIVQSCDPSQVTSTTSGSQVQGNVWTVPDPNVWPTSAGFTWYNQDGTTTNGDWWAVSTQSADYLLGAALAGSDFFGFTSYAQVNVEWVASLPTYVCVDGLEFGWMMVMDYYVVSG